jgi:hypothetical protein
MRGRAFSIAAGVSLLMLVAVCGMWVRSHWVLGLAHHGTPMIVAGDAEWLTYQTFQSCGGGVEYMRLKALAERGRIRHDTPVGWGYGRFARKDGEAAIGGDDVGFPRSLGAPADFRQGVPSRDRAGVSVLGAGGVAGGAAVILGDRSGAPAAARGCGAVRCVRV